jgi:hypothetical protein
MRASGRIGVLVGGIVWGILTGTHAQAQALPEPTYEIRTVLSTPEGPIVQTTTALLVAPTPVDVDGDLAPDLIAQLTIDAGRAHLRALRLDARALPLQLEAVLSDPRGSSDIKVAFGYDARATDAPTDFEGSIALLTDAQRLGSLSSDFVIVSGAQPMAIVASLFTEPEGSSQRLDPLTARLELDPTPTALHLGLLLGDDLGLTTSRVDLATDRPTHMKLIGRDIRGNRESRLDLELDELPNSLNLSMTESPLGQRTFEYQATDRIDVVEARLSEIHTGTTLNEAHLRFTGMPRIVSFVQSGPDTGQLDASEPIGSLELGATSGGPLMTSPHPAYLRIWSVGPHDSLALRLLGLTHATFDTGEPLTATLHMKPGPFIVDVADGARRIHAQILNLPSQISLTYEERGRLLTEASSRIGKILIDASDPGGIAGRATELEIELIDVPSRLEAVVDASSSEISLTACPGAGACDGRALGILRVDAWIGSRLPAPPHDGVWFEDSPGRYALTALLSGLERISVSTQGTTSELELVKAAGPFAIDVIDGSRTLRVDILDLPSRLSATLDTTGSLSYEASAPIARLDARLSDPTGLSDTMTLAHIELRDMPTSMDVSWASADGRVVMDAGGGTLGSIDVLLTNGPTMTIPSDRDGVIVRESPSTSLLVARLTGLKSIDAQLDPADVTLETTGGRILMIDLEDHGEQTLVTLDRLTPSVQLRMVESGSHRNIIYTASAPSNSLQVTTTTGNRAYLTASLGGPLPAAVSFCSAPGLSCTPAGDRGGRSQADAGSMRLWASEHTTLNLLDCIRPLSGCTRSNASEYIAVDNLRVRVLGFDADSNDPVGYSGHIYMDTDDHALTGSVRVIDGSGGFSANFPSGFRAQNRLGKWTWWGIDKDKSGSITCPGGTSLDVRVFGIWIGVTSYLC